MHLEAMIVRTCRTQSSEFGDALGGDDRASLEMHLQAVIERDWTSTWRRSMDGAPGDETLFISWFTHNNGNATMWLFFWALMESWLMAVDHLQRYAGSWSYIQGSTHNHENEEKTINLGWMLYSVYAVLGVNSWSCHGEIERDDLTLCSAMMVELWMRKRKMGDEVENDMEDTSGYEKSGVRLAWLGWEDHLSVLVRAGSGLVPAISGMANSLAHEIL